MLINGYMAAAAGGSARVVPLYWWQGWSGGWYVASPSALERFVCPAPGVYVVARRETSGERVPLLVGTASEIDRVLYEDNATAFLDSVRRGANEVHVHLPEENVLQQVRAAEDIARGWGLSVLHDPAIARLALQDSCRTDGGDDAGATCLCAPYLF